MTNRYLIEYFITGWRVVDTTTGVALSRPTSKAKCLEQVRRLVAQDERKQKVLS